MEELKHKIIKADWNVYEEDDGNGWEITKFSPAGEDFSFVITHNNNAKQAKEEIIRYTNEFDEEEHIEMWVNAKSEGVKGIPTIKELVKDAEDIQEMLYELCNKIKEEY